ncbi:Inositol 2-dehydrogenase [Aquisphaera giovannonii]|uniref:Inositol 2-dehydrogenase n=1 Tax=Aquisphaera giovannonii TaxID=406548 RepID=A0A5B9WD07_9BACT|nr:Gfo/Idh/MocA family oxidoreductase [Aquisphaera giovannonii]QEH38373.1 Inositol 2-dehydrogenase [Aquisphaera giovannonii]
MKPITRRNFLGTSAATGLAMGMPAILGGRSARAASPNEAIRVAVIGMGSTTAVGGVGGRGHQLLGRLREIPDSNVKIVALCDVDQDHLDREVKIASDRGEKVAAHRDMRLIFDDKDVDAVVVALPNHWHALATIWACQSGKDVYCEKPFSHTIWEGRQMVAAARKYNRMVQAGTQRRSSPVLQKAIKDIRGGKLGAIKSAHALVYRAREGIGKVDGTTPVPASVDYDLWCGPSPKKPLGRKQLHYEWHWFWETGNGEIGNNGPHYIDVCRWALGQDDLPPRVLSIGGRFAYNDCGETPNTQLAWLDYRPAPIICEVRNVSVKQGAIGSYRHRTGGVLIDCEHGYFAGDMSGGAFFERSGKKWLKETPDKKVKDFPDDGSSKAIEATHLANFFAAVRSRNRAELTAEALDGHISAACCHLPNISHRLGKRLPAEAIRAVVQSDGDLADAFDRLRAHLEENGIDLDRSRATLGAGLTLAHGKSLFTGPHAEAAAPLATRIYRDPFVVPESV